MATAQTLIDRSLRLIGALESGESATATESADCLTALNSLIESWQAERLFVYAFQDLTFTLVAGDSTITLGTSGNIGTRPVKIEQVFIRNNNIDYPVQELDHTRFYGLADKSTQADYPSWFYYEPSFTQGILNLYPAPASAFQLHVVMWVPISTLATVGTSVSLPPGYERALVYSLATEIAPEFGKEAPASVVSISREAKANIKRANLRPIVADREIFSRGMGSRNIESDGAMA